MMILTFRRPDGSFVAEFNGMPYHITEADLLFGDAQIAAAQMGASLPFEPSPEPPAPPPVPDEISDRQFAHQLAKAAIISQAEALAFVRTGTIPNALQMIVDVMPDDEARFDAQMFLSGAVVFKRSHPLTAAIGTAYGFSPDQMDDFFHSAASL